MLITLTERAAARAHSYLAKQANAQGLRLGVHQHRLFWLYVHRRTGGHMSTRRPDFPESQGVKVVSAPKNLPYLDGMEVDYAKRD